MRLVHHGRPAAAEALGLEGVVELPLDDLPGACALERHAIVHRRRGSARGVGRQFALEHEVDRAVAGRGDPEGKAAAVCLHVDRVEKRCPREDARIERYVAEGEPHHGEPEPDELIAPGRVGGQEWPLADVREQYQRRHDRRRQRALDGHEARRGERGRGHDDRAGDHRDDPRAERVEHEQRSEIRDRRPRLAAGRRPHAGSGGHRSGAVLST